MGQLAGARVLIAEDNFLIAEHLRTVIESGSGKVIGPVADAGNACALARSAWPDIAVLDMQLRGGDAEPVMVQLDRRHVPFIILSGYERSIVPRLFYDAHYLAKPVADDNLIDLIAMTLRLNSWHPHLDGRAGFLH